MLYYVLDQDKQLAVYMYSTCRAICCEFGITQQKFEMSLNNNIPIKNRYVIIEGEDEEEWICFYKKDNRSYFVSSEGKVRMYDVKTKKYVYGFATRKKNEVVVEYEGHTELLKNLVATYHLPNYKEGCTVHLIKAGKGYGVDNISVYKPAKNKVAGNKQNCLQIANKAIEKEVRRIGWYLNNSLTAVYENLDECCTKLHKEPDWVLAKLSDTQQFSGNGLRYIL